MFGVLTECLVETADGKYHTVYQKQPKKGEVCKHKSQVFKRKVQ